MQIKQLMKELSEFNPNAHVFIDKDCLCVRKDFIVRIPVKESKYCDCRKGLYRTVVSSPIDTALTCSHCGKIVWEG